MVTSTYGDILIPSALILPNVKGQSATNISGSIGISGSHIVFNDGTAWRTLSGATIQ